MDAQQRKLINGYLMKCKIIPRIFQERHNGCAFQANMLKYKG